ncbi:unnamed protein product [Adineta ricciae]|uniref:NHL repeat containing protein-like protein n=1 Tax=Adineta ricciae TaxID=249248 RepID=A0A814KKU8_ADIRI|nr:unnamed protein product [Adineta ricciae]
MLAKNRLSLSSNSQWNPNGKNLVGLFIDENNTIYISNEQILIFVQGNVSLVGNVSMNWKNTSSLFVTNEEKIYVATFHSSNVNEIEVNSSSSIVNSISRMKFCEQCFDIFIISKSLLHQWDYPSTVAGTGSEGSTSITLRNPRGIFLDENNADLFVVDCGNNRIQKFHLGSFEGETIISNQTFPLNCPSEITLDNQGFVFVVDSSNN